MLRKNPTVRAGFEPGTSRSPVISLTSRPPSPHVHVMHDFENALSIFDFRHSDALCFRNQSNVLSPSVAWVAARSKAVVLLLFSYCLILDIDMQYLVSFLVLQSSCCRTESWLLYFNCLPGPGITMPP